MSSKAIIEQFVKTYRSLTDYPTLVSAEILGRGSNPDVIKISSKWSQRNLVKEEMTKSQRFYIFKSSSSELVFESSPVDISSEQLTKYSNSEKFQCVVKEAKKESKKKQFLEVWNKNGLLKSFDVSAFDVHGDIYCDGEFGCLEWSPSEDKIVYIAEKKGKKAVSFYKQKNDDAKDETDEKESFVGGEYIYKPDWGEQLVGKHQPVVGVCDLKTETLKVLDGIPPNFSPGQLVWSKDGKGIYGIALENEPRRLGLIYCTNRLSYIFYLSLNGEFKLLSDKNQSVRSPRLSLDGKSLFWLQRPAGGAHGGCQELVKLDLATNKKEVLIGIIRSGNKTFSGLFNHGLPARCFSKDGKKLFFSTCNRLKTVSYYLNLENKEIVPLETGDGSATILDVHDDIILISAGSLQRPPSLKMSKSLTKIEWISVTSSDVICKDSVYKEMDFQAQGNDKFTYYNAIYYGPPAPSGSGQTVPLIVYPHGGPHSASINDYSLDANFFVSLGYGMLMVNYRGSTGVGQDGVEFLLGKIGCTDVKDNHEAVNYILKNIPYLNPKNIFLYGKSHGGYLVEQLSAQYPDFYRAVVSANPVTDVNAMYVMSDIPDWAASESGMSFDESKALTVDQVGKMHAVSPVLLADKIKAPTLFLIGKNDLRVPFYEGIRMYNALKARNVKTRLNLYDDNHTLGSVPNHFDCVINSALWFTENKA